MGPEIDLSLSPLPIRRAVVELPSGWLPPVALDAAPGETLVQLNLNEPAVGPSPAVEEAIRAAVASAGRYPDPRCRRVAAALAGHTQVPPERISVANGSDELITMVSTAFLEPGIEAVVPVPSFPRYIMATRVAGATPVPVPVAADGVADVDALLAAVNAHTRLVWCATPNNPTGGFVDEPAARRLIAGVPANVVLAFDEAYFEFGQAAGAPDLLRLLAARRGPWVTLRTFSKAYGLAGVRVGYALASSSEFAEAINRLRNIFAVNVFAQAAAVAALGDPAHMRRIVEGCAAERERMRDALAASGLRALPSAANFLAVETPLPALQAAAALRRAGILVAPINAASFPTSVRVTVGTRAQNDAAVAALRALRA
jgi:histidinol-phosphate aminotransferase